MNFAKILLGLLMMFFGRSLYWVLVGMAGFVVGAELAAGYLPDQEPMIILLIALAAGIVGALIAMVLQRLAFALAGFFTAGYLGIFAANASGIADQNGITAAFLVAGVVGAVIAFFAMDWVIVILSSLAGAAALVTGLQLVNPTAAVVFVVLAVIGILVQSRGIARGQAPTEAHQD